MKSVDLVVNVGNTNTSLALVRGGRVLRRLVRPTAAGLPNLGNLRRAFFRTPEIRAAAVASVVPSATRGWRAWCRAAGARRVVVLDHRTDLGLSLRYPRPETLGADRLANLAAVAGRLRGPAVIVDIGTAVTFDAIDARGAFVGGVIAPGPAMMLDYLADRTAKLPRLAPGGRRAGIGRSTASAMRIGAREGYRGMLRGILVHLLRQPALRGAAVIGTGGAARLLRGLAPRVAVDRDLTLKGLAAVLTREAGNGGAA